MYICTPVERTMYMSLSTLIQPMVVKTYVSNFNARKTNYFTKFAQQFAKHFSLYYFKTGSVNELD